MLIELMSCRGCWRVVDQHNFSQCKTCNSKIFDAIGPSKFNLVRWFLSDYRHVIKLIVLDLKGKDYE